VITDIDGLEEECFSKFPAYIRRYQDTSPGNYVALNLCLDTGRFRGVFFAPNTCRATFPLIRGFYYTDGTHTLSK